MGRGNDETYPAFGLSMPQGVKGPQAPNFRTYLICKPHDLGCLQFSEGVCYFIDQNSSGRTVLESRIPNVSRPLIKHGVLEDSPFIDDFPSHEFLEAWASSSSKESLAFKPSRWCSCEVNGVGDPFRSFQRFWHCNATLWLQVGVSENSVPLNPMVSDHYPY